MDSLADGGADDIDFDDEEDDCFARNADKEIIQIVIMLAAFLLEISTLAQQVPIGLIQETSFYIHIMLFCLSSLGQPQQ